MAKKVKKEIKIEKKPEQFELVVNGKPKDPCLEGQFPIGSVVNGVNVVEKQTDTSSYLRGEDNNSVPYRPNETLSEDEVKKITEKIDKERFEKIIDRTEELKKPYSPRENVDLKIFSDFPVKDLIKLAGNFAKMYKEKAAELREEEFKKDWAISKEKEKVLKELVDELTKPRTERTDPVARVADEDYKGCKGPVTISVPRAIIDSFKKDGFAAPEDTFVETFKKLGYVSPKCRVIEEEDLKHEDKKPVAGWFNGICQEMMDLHERKNKDYGNAAHESYEEFGLISYVIRLNDKMKRLKSLTKPGVEQEVKSESIEDTLMDLAAYAIMAIESLRTS